MSPTYLRALMILLALLGFADAFYLTDMAFTGGTLACDIQGLSGCNTVAQSAYSRVFGLPLALYGVVFYSGFLLALFSYGRISSLLYRRALIFFAAAGALSSTYFLYLQQFVIDALCVYCLASALVSFLLAYCVYLALRKEPAEPLPSPK